MTLPPPPSLLPLPRGPSAVVLSGGGGRGAYEVGVLKYLYGDFAKRHGVPRFDVVSGTSVGAINGAYLASIAHDPVAGMPRLVSMWSGLELDRVLRFGVTQAARIPRVLFGGRDGAGLFDAAPMIRLVTDELRWTDVARNVRRGRLQALTVSATHVATGRPWVFVDQFESPKLPPLLAPSTVIRADRIGPQHVLASASIPVVFPPVPVHGELFVDGGLRLNTPMAPAIMLGARRLLVISLSSPMGQSVPAFEPGVFPSVGFLLGKVLNAFLLDHVTADIHELEKINRLLDDGIALYGPEFVERMNARARLLGRPGRERVHALAVHPSQDIGRLAGQHLRRHEKRFGRALGKTILRLLDLGENADADLMSYLLFDGEFSQLLIELGESDARAREADFVEFFRPTPPSEG